jgi:hypothetical protein
MKFVVRLVVSMAAAIILFLVLTYTYIAPKIVNWLMVVSGYDFYQGETRSPYVFNFMLCIFGVLFIIMFSLSYRFLFKKRK